MATIRLVPSTYAVSHSSYVSVTNPSNMYNNTDHTSNYASIKGRNNSSNTYYCYVRGFNFDDVPSGAVVSDFSVKIRAYRNSYLSTSSSYYLRLCNGTSAISNTTLTSALTTTSTVYTFPTTTLSWDTIKGYGSDFGIYIPLRRGSSSGTPYVYVYGIEIEVTYTMANPRTITSTLTGNGTINPSGAQTYYDGDTYTLTITPTDTASAVTVTKDNVDVSSNLVAHYHREGGTSSSSSVALGTYTLVSGSFNGSGASYFSGLVGKDHTNSSGSTNYYSGGSGTIAVFTYDVGVTLPSDAEITGVTVQVSGHAESTSQSSEYMCAQLVSSDLNTEFTSELNFKNVGTSNSVQTLTTTTLPTVTQAANMKLRCRLGYYGGALGGATVTITYTVGGTEVLDYYTYSYTVSGDSTIAVVIGTLEPKTVTVTGAEPSGSTTVPYGDPFSCYGGFSSTPIVLDNGINVSSQLVRSAPTFSWISNTPSGTYSFVSQSNWGFFESSPSSTVAYMTRMTYTSMSPVSAYFWFYAGPNAWGAISIIDGELTTTRTTDTTNVYRVFNTFGESNFTYELPAGTHTIDIKAVGASSGNVIRWALRTVSFPYKAPSVYTYTINRVTDNHTIAFTDTFEPLLYVKMADADTDVQLARISYDNSD